MKDNVPYFPGSLTTPNNSVFLKGNHCDCGFFENLESEHWHSYRHQYYLNHVVEGLGKACSRCGKEIKEGEKREPCGSGSNYWGEWRHIKC